MARRHRWWMFGWGFILLLGLPLRLEAATYYLGAFTGSTPLDDADCGTGIGTHPNPHPCATLAYWTQNRRAIALVACSPTSPCTVRFAPGTYATSGGNYNHCVIAQSNTTYEGRLANDSGLPSDFNAVVIDAANAGPHRFTAPCRGMSLIPQNASDTYPDTSVSQLQNFTVRYLTLANAPYDGNEYRTGANLYGNTGSTNVLVDHVRVTGNKSGGLAIGEQNWRQYQCDISRDWCSINCQDQGSECTDAGGRCGVGKGICREALDWDCQATGRRTTNITVQDSQFDTNDQDKTLQGDSGLLVSCLDGFTILRSKAFDNHDPSVNCCAAPSATGCDHNPGLHVHAGINGHVDTFEAYDNGSSDIEVGDSHKYSNHDNVLERLYWHTSCTSGTRSGFKPVGAYNTVVRNSVGIGWYLYNVEEYNCTYHFTFENNTVWNTGGGYAMSLQDSLDWTVRNNIFRNTWTASGVIGLERRPGHDAGTVWDHNVLVNAFSNGYAFEASNKVRDGCTCTIPTQVSDCGAGGVCSSGVCSAGTTTRCNATSCTGCGGDADCNAGRACVNTGGQCVPLKTHGVYALNDYNPPAPVGNQSCTAGFTCLTQTATGVTNFQGATSGWFGGGEGQGEKWGIAPLVVNASSPSAANLHLLSTDLIARDAGVTIPGLTTDYDGQARPFGQFYDIGADEYSTSAPGLLGDLDGNTVVDVLDLQRMVNVLLGLETDQAVIARADLDGQNGPTVLDLQLLVNKLLGI